MYDLLVIGGGPAGSTCARRAAERGLDVALIERCIHPRKKPCGGAISPRAIELLRYDLSQIARGEFHAARVHTPSGRTTVLTREGLTGLMIDRPTFDEFLLKKAIEAGVEVRQDTKIVGIEQLRKGVRALGVGDSYKAHLLVGADGVNGLSARILGIRKRWQADNIAVCINAEVPMKESEIARIARVDDNPAQIALDLYFGLIDWGYGWCFPKTNTLNVGIGCRVEYARNLRNAWESIISHIERTKGISLDVSQRTSARVPIGGITGRVIARRSMLIGDAAGLVSPISGEGISYAIESGILAADVAYEAVRDKSPVHIAEYDRRLKQGLNKELDNLRQLANILYRSSKNIELISKIASEDPVIGEYLIDVLARVSPFSNLKRRIYRRMLTRHPLKTIKFDL
ncbi:MAG: geranylgeranyl reductase family protein [Candidatus Thorarchaeota archaeon]|nr:geranylgeranyl reductase family protein [Candidatus Thorarchaeota archaeon]